MECRGVKLVILILLLASLAGCMNEVKTDRSETPAHGISYLALGDSYTIGESVPDTLRWPVQLAGELRQAGVSVADPVIIARTGWTTGELIEGISNEGITGVFDMVSLLIGVNNQYRHRDPEVFRKEFKELLGIAESFCRTSNRKVFVLTIPDWGVTPFASGRDIA
ncbi:MAG: hypothetical protein R2727_12380, partial [Bacteroidales bacterium]